MPEVFFLLYSHFSGSASQISSKELNICRNLLAGVKKIWFKNEKVDYMSIACPLRAAAAYLSLQGFEWIDLASAYLNTLA